MIHSAFNTPPEIFRILLSNGKRRYCTWMSKYQFLWSAENLRFYEKQVWAFNTYDQEFSKLSFILGKSWYEKNTVVKKWYKLSLKDWGLKLLVLALTCVASIIIDGIALHSDLSLATNLNTFSSLWFIRQIVPVFYGTYVLFNYWRFSMIGCNMMNAIEILCKEGKPVSQEPFGGLFVYGVSDNVRQLLPVQENQFSSCQNRKSCFCTCKQ